MNSVCLVGVQQILLDSFYLFGKTGYITLRFFTPCLFNAGKEKLKKKYFTPVL